MSKNIIIFYPTFAGGGITRNLENIIKFFKKNKTQTKSSKIMIFLDVLKKPSFKTFNLSGIIIKKNSNFLTFSQK